MKLIEISLNNNLIFDTKGKRATVNEALVMKFLNKLKISFTYTLTPGVSGECCQEYTVHNLR